jgi:hypothetical protein
MKSPTIAAVALIVIRPSATSAVGGGTTVRIIAQVLTLHAGLRLAKIGPRASTTENWPTSRWSCRTGSRMSFVHWPLRVLSWLLKFDARFALRRHSWACVRAAPPGVSGVRTATPGRRAPASPGVGRQKTADCPACNMLLDATRCWSPAAPFAQTVSRASVRWWVVRCGGPSSRRDSERRDWCR